VATAVGKLLVWTKAVVLEHKLISLIHNKLTSFWQHVKLPLLMKKSLIFLILIFFCARFICAADTPAPPSFNPDGGTPVGGDPNHPEDKGDLPNYDAKGDEDSDLPAPQISEEQLIKNAMEIAYQLYHAEDYEACAKATSAILDKYPKRKLFWVHYLDALCLEHEDLYAQAVTEYELVKKEALHSTYAHAASFRIGLCDIRLHRNREAIYVLREIIETDPLSEYRLQAYIHLGNLYRQDRNWKSAENIYKDLIRLFPDTSWSHVSMLYLAECYAFSNESQRAIRIYTEMQHTKSVPIEFKAQAQLRIGEIYLGMENWQDAIGSFRIALRDYADIPGISTIAEEKIGMAQEGRRTGNVPYKTGHQPSAVIEGPEDEAYRLKQQNEALPY